MSAARKFGWFGGVFTPSILTILGVIMYLRLPAIVGQAGLVGTLGIIALAHVISITTGLSVASVATDKKVRGGGTYYMISRSLGLSIGGTLGVALFVGLSFAVSLYIVGFSESFLGFLGMEQSVPNIRVTGTIVLLTVTVVTFISTSLALRTQFVVLTAIALSLISVVAGVGRHDHMTATPGPESLPEAAPFIVLFAIFFPAVTGFEAGVSMSGDLRDPKRAIPLGSLSAIGVGLVVYVGLATFLALTVSPAALAGNPDILTEIAWFGPLVLAGVWGATISSALGSILGAPRILQATSVDRVIPRFFAAGSGRAREPRRALLITFLIAWAGILLGELDTIARVVSMFFIATYGFLNLSCAIENWASPDFRPALRVPRVVSVLGAVACLVVMIQLDVVAMIAATVVLGLLYLYLARKQLRLESGDAWQGFWSSIARAALHRLDRSPAHKRNWRPNILLFGDPEGGRSHLLEFGRELTGKRGMVTNFHLVERPELGDESPGSEPADLDGEDPPYGVFARRVECVDVYDGMGDIARYYGHAGVEPNTVLLGWPRRVRHQGRAEAMIRRFTDLRYNVLLLDFDADRGFGHRQRVDFWVLPGSQDVGLMLALAGYFSLADRWRDAELRFMAVSGDGAAAGHVEARRLAAALEAERLRAEVRVVAGGVDRRSLPALMAVESAGTDLTVIGLGDAGGLRGDGWISTVTHIADGLGSTLVVHAGPDLREARRRVAPTSAEAVALSGPAEVEPAALDVPDDPPLRAAVQWLDTQLEETAAACADGPLVAAYVEHQRVRTETARLIRQVRDEIGALGGEPVARALRETRKAWGDLLFHARRLIAEYGEEGVPAQADALATLIQRLIADRARIIDSAERSVRASNRARVSWRRFVREQLEIRIPRAGLNAVDALAVDAATALGDAPERLGATGAVLERLEQALEAGDGARLDVFLAELVAIAAAADAAADAGRATTRRAASMLRAVLRDAVSRVAVDVRKAAAGERVPRRKGRRRTGERLAERLRDRPAVWRENQRLRARTVDVDLALLAFQHRARTVVRRDVEEVRQRLQGRVAARLEAVDQALQEHANQTDQDPAAEFTRTFEDWRIPSIESALDGLMEELRPATAELPENAEILADPSVITVASRDGDAAEGLEVALRSLVELRLESDFIGPLREDLSDARGVLARAEDTARDAVRLASVRLDGAPDEARPEGARLSMIESARSRLHSAREDVAALSGRLATAASRRLEEAFAAMTPHALVRSGARVPGYVRALRGREALSWFQRQRRRAREAMAGLLGLLLYQRSATLVAARELERREGRSSGATLPRLVAAVRPDPAVMEALPYHYRQLFLGRPTYTRNFWVGWKREKAAAAAAVAGHRRGQAGGLAIIGEPNGGKTVFARFIADEFFDGVPVLHISPPPERSTDPGIFRQRLRQALGSAAERAPDDDPLAALPAGVVVLDDFDLWWERSDDGYEVVREVLRLIRHHGERVFFIVVADAHAFRFIQASAGLGAEFLSVIECGPFSARELGAVIDLRHTSTGLVFEYDGRSEQELSAWKRARLFNRIYDYSRGSIGAALQAWIAHIRAVEGDRLELVAPKRADLDALDTLSTTQVLILVQVILHRALTRDRFARLCPLDAETLERDLDSLLLIGLLEEARPGLIAIDPFVRPHLTAWCVARELVP